MNKKYIIILITFIAFFATSLLRAEQGFYTSEDSLTVHVIEVDTLGNDIGDMEFDRDYHKELVQFYIDRQEYELALGVIDSALTRNVTNDSLFLYKAISYEGLKDWDRAANSYSELYLKTDSDSLKFLAKNGFIYNVKQLNPIVSIEKISTMLDSVSDSPQYPEFLMTIAEVYEENQLYEEANDIYKTVLGDTTKVDTTGVGTPHIDTTDILFKLAVNDIYLKNYEDVVFTMEPFILEADSVRLPEALFFSYISHYSLGNYPAARKHLLRLYLNYPTYGNRFEQVMGLAELFEKEKRYIFGWYLLENFMTSASEAEKYQLDKRIKMIRERMGSEEDLPNQFKLLQSIPERLEELQ